MKVLKDYKHVQRVRKRGHPGEHRHYLRRGPGRPKRVSLPGKPGSPEWDAAYYAGFVEGGARANVSRATKGTVSWEVDTYLEHPDLTQRGASMQRKHRRNLLLFKAEHGTRMLRDTPLDKLKKLFVQVGTARGPQAANQWMIAVEDLFRFAYEQAHIPSNPVPRGAIKRNDREGSGARPWAPEEVQRFRDYWAIGTRERLAFELMVTLALRRSDVHRIRPSWVRDGELTYTQHKNRNKRMKGNRGGGRGISLTVPLPSALLAIIDETRRQEKVVRLRRADRFLLKPDGTPYSETSGDDNFGDWFKSICLRAGLPKDCSPHGVRKFACAKMISDGKTPDQVRAVSGHQTYEQLLVYIHGRDQKRLAREALAA